MSNADLINELYELEAIADLWEDKARKLKDHCHRTRAKLEGVSTPSARKGKKAALDAKQLAQIVARRNKRIFMHRKPQT